MADWSRHLRIALCVCSYLLMLWFLVCVFFVDFGRYYLFRAQPVGDVQVQQKGQGGMGRPPLRVMCHLMLLRL